MWHAYGCNSVASKNQLESLAHDLANSLSIISTEFHVLKFECSTASPEVIKSLEDEIEIMKSILQRLRDLRI
jgi:hypothetical protein